MLNRLRLLVGEKLCGTKSVFSAFFNWYSGQQLPFKIKSPRLFVRQGKGGKDRVVYLNNYIRDRLAAFTRGRDAGDNVLGLAPKPISLKIGGWAHKAGVLLHPHSLRHKFATDILDRRGNIRAVQQLPGHESLGTAEIYLAVTNDSRTIWTFMPATGKPSPSCHVI